jgi:hypothetical protein
LEETVDEDVKDEVNADDEVSEGANTDGSGTPPQPDPAEEVETNLYNLHEGTTGRLPGTYLDEVERQGSELERAAREGREPDLENPPANAGTPLVTADQLPQPGTVAGGVTDDKDPVAVEPFTTANLPVSQAIGDVQNDADVDDEEVSGTPNSNTEQFGQNY